MAVAGLAFAALAGVQPVLRLASQSLKNRLPLLFRALGATQEHLRSRSRPGCYLTGDAKMRLSPLCKRLSINRASRRMQIFRCQ
ncbi:hypothetical protein EAH73_05870 [Hymenobacter nivis]|uniref:Uncharacterized protein n=1 Tax=Hymenobacter nivis TaxID=1850093 RepID=A0A502GZJ7_9BACT|nr:hypothetical protein EAH73_05870 [Hymenobacter nivis]